MVTDFHLGRFNYLYFNIILYTFLFSGVCLGLFSIPLDFQQGENYKLIFVHVPAAWVALICYIVMVCFSIIYLIFKLDIFYIISKMLGKYGMIFSFLTLGSGSLWGKPLWGAFWVWDARLTSMLILFFIYLGYYLFNLLLKDSKNNKQLSSIFIIFGFINLPIIKYSVEWWTTMHQNSSVSFSQMSHLHFSVYLALLYILISFLMVIIILIYLELKIKYIEIKEYNNKIE